MKQLPELPRAWEYCRRMLGDALAQRVVAAGYASVLRTMRPGDPGLRETLFRRLHELCLRAPECGAQPGDACTSALLALDAPMRSVLLLRLCAGFQTGEIARLTGMEPGRTAEMLRCAALAVQPAVRGGKTCAVNE